MSYRQQQELEEERMLYLLALLQKVKRAGLESEAMDLSRELGLITIYEKEQSNG